jgi:hypothetical protein
MSAGSAPTGEQVVWAMSTQAAEDLAMLLGTLEDFLRQASLAVVIELAEFPPARPADPSTWADWVADRLGEAALDLHTLTTTRTRAGEQR